MEPTDVSVNRNKNVILHCQAGGVPTPTIVWKKALGSKAGEFEEIRDQMHSKFLSNGSLILQHVQEEREGFYLCQANNGIGNGIGKVVQLKVNCNIIGNILLYIIILSILASPYFSQSSNSISVKKGDTAILPCEVNGDKPINIIWMKGGENILNSIMKDRLVGSYIHYQIHLQSLKISQ